LILIAESTKHVIKLAIHLGNPGQYGLAGKYRVGANKVTPANHLRFGWTAFLAMCLYAASPTLIRSQSHAQSNAASSDELYEVGTDIGANYLSEHIARLRITLLLRDCGENDLSDQVAKGLPKSIVYALTKMAGAPASQDVKMTVPQKMTVAQIARAYLLGYEIGVRTEFQRQTDNALINYTCIAARTAAHEMLNE